MRWIIYLLIGLYIYLGAEVDFIKQFEFVKTVNKIEVIDTKEETEPVASSVTGFIELLDSLKIRFPTIVFAQIVHETDFFSSKIYKECNNLLGMKPAQYRDWDIGMCRGHALYSKKIDSLYDYAEYQAEYLPQYERQVLKRPATEEDYFNFLTWAKYAEDPDYLPKIKHYNKAIKTVLWKS